MTAHPPATASADLDPARLAEVCRANKVPGAVLAVRQGDTTSTATHGVTNLRTGVEVTADTVFQIGSITKVWTATLVMMLAEDGLVDLDVPVRTYLPDFRVADAEVSAQVTIRHLLTHTSGIGGDHFLDTGRGADCLERYVASCADLAQDHRLGATMSYCNSGYSILGRLIEVVAGRSWDGFLRERIIQPLGLDSVGTLPEHAIVHRAAAGHISLPGSDPELSRVWGMARSSGPAGLIHGSAEDLLAFARLHMAGGVAVDGTRLLSPAGAAAMQEPQVEVPDRWSLGTHWGLGWIIYTGAAPGYGHDGAVIGQYAFLRVVPEADLAVCLLTNGGTARRAWQALFSEVVRDAAGIEVDLRPPEPPVVVPALDLSRYTGRYERWNFLGDVGLDDQGTLQVVLEDRSTVELLPPEARTQTLTLTPVDEALFIARAEPDAPPTPIVFFDFEDGRPRRFHAGARAMSRRDA